MKSVFSKQAKLDFRSLPANIRKRAEKQLKLLEQDLRHPSIRAKKYDASRDIWQGRVTQSYRFYFQIIEDVYRILRIIEHPK